MAEAMFKQMIASLVRQTKPQTFRHSKPSRYPQRRVSTAANSQPREPEASIPQWQAHTVRPSVQPQTDHPRLDRLRSEAEPRPFSSFLTDNYSRQHNYLRISVTERCNLRCLYCMPEEGVPLSPPAHLLTTPEIVYLSELFVNQGVNKIRLTGGEPTIRKDIVDLMHQIGKLRNNGLKELCITTNGISLHRKLDSMVESGLTGVNLSLDTLDPFQFTVMTRRNGHEAVMKSINRILEMNKLGAGIKLKINCVVMRGLNDREILPFVELTKDQDLEVRFIEYMPFDGNKWSEKKMLGFGEMLALIRERYPDVNKVQDHKNDTSKTYKVPGFAGRMGFITSMTHNFCGTCNRLRITGDGNLKVCLFGNAEVSLRDILRESNNGNPIDAEAMEAIRQLEMDRRQQLAGSTGELGVSEKEANLLSVIGMAVKNKKEKHAGIGELENMKNRPMILIDDTNGEQHMVNTFREGLPCGPSSPKNLFLSSRLPGHLLNPYPPPFSLSAKRYISLMPDLQAGRRMYSRSNSGSALRFDPFRRVHGQSTHRRQHSDDPENIPATTTRTWPASRRRTLEEGNTTDISRAAQYARFLTRDLVRARSSHTRSHDSNSSDERLETETRQHEDPMGAATEPSDSPSASIDQEVPSLTHLTANGEAHMVSIAGKQITSRSATATTLLLFSNAWTYSSLLAARLRKGDAMSVARIAGIQAAKKTSDLIPLAHPGLNITGVSVRLEAFVGDNVPYPLTKTNLGVNDNVQPLYGGVLITATVACEGKTGVEMEAITAASVAGLTMYDMLKGVDKAMSLTSTRVVAKSGGKSGDWKWDYDRNKVVKQASGEREREQTLEEQDRKAREQIVRDKVRGHEHAVQAGPVSGQDFRALRARRYGQLLEERGRQRPLDTNPGATSARSTSAGGPSGKDSMDESK